LLARHGREIGFFRPVVEEPALRDHLVTLVTSRYEITVPHESMFGVTHATARDLISRDKEDELYSRILEKYRGLAQECDFVVCAGTDYKTMHTALEFEFNVEVARNLGAPLMAVVAGQGRSVGEIADAVHELAEFLEAKKCDVLSVIVNRVAPDDVTEALARPREGAPDAFPVFVLPAHPLLDKPTVGEIKRALGAEMLHGDAQRLDREVAHYKVAAMELPHFLDHLEEGSLVITPGDRSDIMIGTLVADAATSYPGVAGVILTGGFKPVPQVQRLIEGLKRLPVPILYVKTDTFATATIVNSLHAGIAPGNQRKIQVLQGSQALDIHLRLQGLVSFGFDDEPPKTRLNVSHGGGGDPDRLPVQKDLGAGDDLADLIRIVSGHSKPARQFLQGISEGLILFVPHGEGFFKITVPLLLSSQEVVARLEKIVLADSYAGPSAAYGQTIRQRGDRDGNLLDG